LHALSKFNSAFNRRSGWMEDACIQSATEERDDEHGGKPVKGDVQAIIVEACRMSGTASVIKGWTHVEVWREHAAADDYSKAARKACPPGSWARCRHQGVMEGVGGVSSGNGMRLQRHSRPHPLRPTSRRSAQRPPASWRRLGRSLLNALYSKLSPYSAALSARNSAKDCARVEGASRS
jgi:hypothetical protein